MRKRRVDQFSPSVPERDAIGNEVIALDRILRSLGYQTRIFAEEERSDRGVRSWSRYADSPGDVLIVHYSHGSDAYGPLLETAPESIFLYHNNAPIQFILGLEAGVLRAGRQGFDELPRYAGLSVKVVAHSELSASDLRRAGYGEVQVIPYLLNEDLYSERPAPDIVERYSGDGGRNLLMVGRVVPHKKIEDGLFILDYLQRHVNPRRRLFVVGSSASAESYQKALETLADEMGLEDVVFTGSVSQSELTAYYQLADVLLFLSEHEGFGVPLVEGMRMDLPVLARASGAAREVLGDAGVLFETADWPLLAETAELVMAETPWREQVLGGQRRRREYYSAAEGERRWRDFLTGL